MISPAASSSAIRVLRADGTVVGAGFLVDTRHVFTCAHVVAEALGRSPSFPTRPSELITLDFPFLPSAPTLQARVTVWQPVNENWDGGDIAGLELLDEAPEGAQPATFAPAMDVWGHDFRAFGFPAIADKGTWSTGRLLAEQGNGWIQVEDNRGGGVPVTQGFSGAAVWDEQLEGVVGMVVATLHDPGGRVGGQAGIRVAFAIPQRLLLTTWPRIQPITRPRVFLSAAQSDTAQRERLQTDLAAGGILVWDEQHGPAGTPSEAEQSQQAIRAAMALLVIASNSTPTSLTVREHLRLAELYQRHIIFIRMDGTSPTSSSQPTPDAPSLTRGADLSRTDPVHGENHSNHTISTTISPTDTPSSTNFAYKPGEDASDTERKLAEIARQNLNLAWINASDLSNNDYKKTTKTIKEMLSDRSSVTALLDVLAEPAKVPRNPYVGLQAFTARERGDFFGREAVVGSLHAEVVRRLDPALKVKEGRLLTVIGASGSGKSSVVMAGLLPRLQEDAESEGWLYLPRMLPGSSPIEALIDTLSPYFPDASFQRLREDLTGDRTDGLHRLARQLARREGEPGRHVVLFVDQFEELFTQTVGEEERRRFLDLLSTAASASDGTLLILLTLRADFYSRLMEYPDFYALLASSLYPLLPLQSSELRAAIAQPAAQPDVQLSFEGNLLGDLLFDVQRQAGALPLLQFTLQQLYERRQGSRLTLKAYKEIGEVNGALARYTQATYESLPADQRELARILFLRLLEPGSSPEESTRRRASLSELAFPDPDQTRRMQAVLDTFISTRLLTSSAYPLTGETTIEVSHEALIRAWPQLADWLRAARDDLPLQRKISEDAAQWQTNNRPADRLYRGSQLKQARTWAIRNTLSVTKQEQIFLHASQVGRVRSVVTWLTVFILVFALAGATGWLLLFQPDTNYNYVTNTNDDGPGSLRWAITNAQPNSTITFSSDLASKTITLTSGDIHIRQKNLSIQGLRNTISTVISRSNDLSIIVDPSASVVISNIILRGSETKKTFSILINYGNLRLDGCTISNNITEGYGGGIFNSGTLSMVNSIISHNKAGIAGGGIYNEQRSSLIISHSVIVDNTSGDSYIGDGGGISNFGTVDLSYSIVLRNTANLGGGIDNTSELSVGNSTISNNRAESGGGIYNEQGPFSVINSTISDNVAISSGSSIASYDTSSNTNLIFCSIYHNKVSRESGGSIIVDNAGAALHMKASIIAESDASKHSAIEGGMITSEGYNLVQNMVSKNFEPNDAHKTDLLLADTTKTFGLETQLQKNGGPTLTYALRPGPNNPAINAVPMQICTDDQGQTVNVDQRGMPRPGRNKLGKPACDIGSFESSN